MMNVNNTLKALTIFAGIKSTAYFDSDYVECNGSKTNIAKIKKIADACKYAGLHLHIRLCNASSTPFLRYWVESNTVETRTLPYTLINFEHDLDSMA